MTHTQLTTSEAALIHGYLLSDIPITTISRLTHRSRPTIYRVKHWIESGKNMTDWYEHTRITRSRRGRHRVTLSDECMRLVKQLLVYGYSPDVIAHTQNIGCSARTLYRLAEKGVLSLTLLPWKGKRRKNHTSEKRGRLKGAVSIHERSHVFPHYRSEFGHWEGDTIVGKGRKSCVVTLVERASKNIVTLPTQGRKATDIEASLHAWLTKQPVNSVKSITFDRGLEFAKWKQAIRDTSTSVFFADPGSPGQRGLNENSNGLLRRSGLPKSLDFNTVTPQYIKHVAVKRNSIPRKSLDYKTPQDMYDSYIARLER